MSEARASEGLTHWYTQHGEPCYTVVGKNGKVRPTTLRDARDKKLAPSVTGIIKCAAAPGLVHYQQEQIMLSALTLPRYEHEVEAEWISRVWADSREHARKAAEKGTACHAAIQQHYEGQIPDPAWFQHVQGAVAAISDRFPGARWNVEQSFCHSIGYGGKVDLHTAEGCVLDIKTKEFSETPDTYNEHHMQLAAYRQGLGMPAATCGICFVSVSVPGLARIVMCSDEELDRGWEMFKALLAYWKAKSKYESAIVHQ